MSASESEAGGLGRVGQYTLVRRIGAGGMAEVFEAVLTGPHGFSKRVALKRILPHAANDGPFVDMFASEARLVATLSHPNLVQVFDFGEAHGTLFLTMELVDGTTVGKLMRALAARGEAVPIDLALHLAAGAARGLAHAHEARDARGAPLNLVHRDVSPGNLLIARTGHVKLADFGIAHTEVAERHTVTNHLRGKVGYMSPQQVSGDALTPRSDVFTLGIVLTEMLIGESLFARGGDLDVLLRIRDVDLTVLHRSKRDIPSAVKRLLHWALARDAAARPTARQLANALERLLAERRAQVDLVSDVARLLVKAGLAEPSVLSLAPDEPEEQPTGRIPSDETTSPSVQMHTGQGAEAPGNLRYLVRADGVSSNSSVTFPELVRLTTTGVICKDTVVRALNREPRRASELPELRRIFSTPALQWDSAEHAGARVRGDLGAAMLLPLIHSLSANRETGMLYLEGQEGRRKKVYFVDGRPDFVASNDRAEMLGDYLVRHGYCMPMELDMALAMMPRFDGRLGDALVNLGIMRPVDLYRAVSAQVRSRYLEAFRWRSGTFRYAREALSNEDTYPIEQDPHALMRDAALELAPSELEAALAPLWERVLTPVDLPPSPLHAYQLPDAWSWALEQAQGGTTVGSLFGRCSVQSGMDGEDAMRAIFLGLSCQLLRAG